MVETYIYIYIYRSTDWRPEGFIAWLHMNASSVWSVYWPDMMHKLARKASLSLTNSGASQWLKKMNKLYRMSLGPWGSGRFGKELLAARKHLLKALKDGSFDQDLLESWLRQVAKDQQVDPAEFSVSDLVLLLEKSGQWLKGDIILNTILTHASVSGNFHDKK